MAPRQTTWRNDWQPADIAMIIIFFALVYAVAIWSGVMERKDMKGKKHQKTGVDYFLGGRDMNWILIGPSIAASNIGTDVLVALAGGVCAGGLGTISYEIGSGWSILCLGFFMGPMYLRAVLKTIPQYMELRYNQWCRITFVCFSTAVFILSKFGVNVYSGSLIFNTMITTPERQYSLWIFIPVLVVITAVYTVVGGLTSVMYADFIQLFLFMVTGYASVGYVLGRWFGHTTAGIRGALNDLGLNHLQHLIQPKDNPDYPWPATTIGMLVHEYYYWSTDQEMAQRVISAKGLGDARVGCAFGSVLKVASVWLAMIPGWTARILYERCIRGDAGYENWCGPLALVGNYDMSDAGDANRAYPLLVMRDFPQGFKGLMIAGFLAAIMSNLSGAINSLATILTYDVYNRFFPPHYQVLHKWERAKRRAEIKGNFNIEKNPRPIMQDHTQRHLVWMGRIFVVVCCAITILWQLGIQHLGSINLFSLTIIIQQHFGANIAATLLIGCTWRGSTEWGGLAGLVAGGAFAVIHAAAFLRNYAKCQAFVVHVPNNYSYVHYPNYHWEFYCLHQTIATCIIWGITLAVNIIVSLPTPKPDYEKIDKYMIYWEDLIPRYIVWIQPSRAKPDLDTGYIDAIRKEALVAQELVDREIEAKKAGKKGEELEKELEGKRELVDPIIDEGYLNKEKAKQKTLMYIADPCAHCAFFFALFLFVYWR